MGTYKLACGEQTHFSDLVSPRNTCAICRLLISMQEGTFTKAIYQRMKKKKEKCLGTYKYAGRHFYLGNLFIFFRNERNEVVNGLCDFKSNSRFKSSVFKPNCKLVSSVTIIYH